jgi:ribosome-associated toxin RatA of RatAB toxin-antitoxin module
MRLLGFFLFVVLLAAGVIALIGSSLPEEHTVTRSVLVPASQEHVFTLISHVQDYPHWRTGVDRVELLPEINGQMHWQEVTSMGTVPEVLTENEPLSHRVVTIDDPTLPYSGTWTFELAPQGGQTQLTITDHGDVSNVFYRFASRYIFGQAATVEQYENDLVKAVQ